MSDLFWIAVILTSPFWMCILIVLIFIIADIIERFLDLFKRKDKRGQE